MTEQKLGNGFVIDFFELMFLAESVIPQGPIARSVCFDNFSEKHYHHMNDNQRMQFFNYVKSLNGFDLNKIQCRNFYARFNPKNQYIITYYKDGDKNTMDCYMLNNEYHVSENIAINSEYITNVIKKYNSETII